MTEKRSSPLFRQKLECLLLSRRQDVFVRVKDVVSRYHLTFKHLTELPESDGDDRELRRAQIVVIAQEDGERLTEFSQRVEKCLQRFPRSWLVTVLHADSLRENIEGTRQERVIPFSPYEFFNTLKLKYIFLQKARSQYFEMSSSDLFPMTSVPFSVAIRLERNQKIQAVTGRGVVLSETKFNRLQASGKLCFHIRDGAQYYNYINNYFDASGMALKKKARALFLSICGQWLELNEYLLFDFKFKPEEEMQGSYSNLVRLGEDLLTLMQGQEGLWEVFLESVQNDCLAHFRAPWVAVYAAMICQKSGKGDPLVAFLGGLLSDVGIFDLEESAALKYLREGESELDESEAREIRKHPILSLNRCLLKKLPLNEQVKAVLVCTHERSDEKGYPNQVPAEKLPFEGQVIRFAELIDLGVRSQMAETGVSFRFLKEKVWEREQSQVGNFSLEFLDAIAASLI